MAVPLVYCAVPWIPDPEVSLLCSSPVGLGQPALQESHICSRFASSFRCSGAEEAPDPARGSLLSVQVGSAHSQAPVSDREQMLVQQHWVLETLRLALLTCCPAELCTAGSAKHDWN